MTDSDPTQVLDPVAVAQWPYRAAAHILGLTLLMAALAALPSAPTDLDRHQFPKETLVHLGTWLAVFMARPLPVHPGSKALSAFLIAFLACSSLSLAGATNLWLGIRALSLSFTLAAAFLTAYHLSTHQLGKILLGWILWALTAAVATGVAQAYGFESDFFANTRVPGGTFGNRNFLAHFCALGLPLTILAALTQPQHLKAVFQSALAALLLALVILTRSRAAWLGTGAGGALLLLCLWRLKPQTLPLVARRGRLLAAALTGGLLAAVLLPNSLSWRSSSPYADTFSQLANFQEGSGHGRVLQYRHSLELVQTHPLLGIGPGNWPIRYPEVAPGNDPSFIHGDPIPLNPWPSSDWIAILSERGILTSLAAMGLALAILAVAWKGCRNGGEQALCSAILLALIATQFVQGSFDVILLLAVPGMLFAISVGVLVARSGGGQSRLPEHKSPWNTLLLLILGLGVLRSTSQTAAYLIAGKGDNPRTLALASRIDPGSYPLQIALARRGSCRAARSALKLAPNWEAARKAARNCGVE